MSRLFSRIRCKVEEKYFENGDVICKDKVKVDLRNGPIESNRIVVDMDKYQQSLKNGPPFIGGRRRRVDLLLVSDSYRGRQWVVPIELKQGAARASDIRDQLSSGSQTAQEMICCNEEVTFVPVLVSGSLHTAVFDKLRKGNMWVEYCGKKYRIELVRHHGREKVGKIGDVLQRYSAK